MVREQDVKRPGIAQAEHPLHRSRKIPLLPPVLPVSGAVPENAQDLHGDAAHAHRDGFVEQQPEAERLDGSLESATIQPDIVIAFA